MKPFLHQIQQKMDAGKFCWFNPCVPSSCYKIHISFVEMLLSMLKVCYCEDNDKKKAKQMQAYIHFADFVDMCASMLGEIGMLLYTLTEMVTRGFLWGCFIPSPLPHRL